MKPVSLLILVVAILLGGIATYFGRVIIARSTVQPTTIDGRIVVAGTTMGFGTVLAEGNLVEMPWAAASIPDGAFTSKEQVLKEGRRVVLTPMSKNEPILNSKITGSGQRGSLSALLEPGMRAITIRVDDVRGVAGFVRPGDRVDILLTQTSNGNAVADVLLQNIKVLAVDQIANEHQESPTVAKAVTAEVNTQQAQKLVLAQGVGSLSLVLRQPDGQFEASSRRVTMADLGGVDTGQQDKITTLEEQIAVMRAAADKAGEKGREEFLNRIAELEARMTSELRKASERPVEKVKQSEPVLVNLNAVVGVTRGVKREEYNVAREAIRSAKREEFSAVRD